MTATVRSATPDDLPRVISHLDREFVAGKGRQISLARRFPGVYCKENSSNIFLLEEKREILSCLASKPVRLNCANHQWHGTMIGAVYTQPGRRGEHLGSHLLETVTRELQNRETDFAVLWTDQTAFYCRLGWRTSDAGVLGSIEGTSAALPFSGEIAELPLLAATVSCIDNIRKHWLNCGIARTADDYRNLPLPADSAQLLFAETGLAPNTYALIGNFRDTAIMYEMIGDPSGFPALWGEIRRRHRKILANDSAGSPSFQWLTRNTGMVFEKKPLAMWQLFSKRLTAANTAQWYIPYFDRI